MKIGVVCDTHNNIKNVRRIVELFNESNPSLVVHTGDITKASTLDLFASLRCELVGVFGNNDVERDDLDESIARHGFHFVEPPYSFECGGRKITVVHDPMTISESMLAENELILHGHTHLKRIEQSSGGLIFNPGECAGHMAGYNAIGLVDLHDLSVEILNF